MKQILVFLLYIGSLGIAAEVSRAFFVLGVDQILLLAGVLIGPIFLLTHVFKNSERLAVAAVHLFAAVAFHPATTLDESQPLGTNDQYHQLLRSAIAPTEEGRWWIRAEASRDLAAALARRANVRLKYTSPLAYWFFPPSVALSIWAALLYWLMPPGGVANRRRDASAT